MATTKPKIVKAAPPPPPTETDGAVLINRDMLGESQQVGFVFWLVGNTPLLTNAWSHKAKLQMLEKQMGKSKKGREVKSPEDDFRATLYQMSEGVYGFPAMGVKNCLLSAAHKDKNIPRTTAQASLWINGEMTRLTPGKDGAICDMPLIRIYGAPPVMREDMVKIGAGLNKVANLAYRAQFPHWALRVTGEFNPTVLNWEKLAHLANDSGISVGLGEWRNEKKGPFGSFHLATVEEAQEWEEYRNGGALPDAPSLLLAAE